MKVLSLNTWQEKGPWRERWEITFRGLEEMKPDIAAFQEVFNKSWAEEVRKRTGSQSLVFFHEPSGLMLISRFRVIRSEIWTLKAKSPTEDYKRYLIFSDFETPSGRICFFNTHLSWKLDESATREAQVDEILPLIESRAGKEWTLITGDFNTAPDTPAIRKMLDAGFTDTYRKIHPGSTELTWDNRNPYAAGASVFLPDRRIDFVFSRNHERRAAVAASEIVLKQPNERGVYASDHYGVLTTFK
jgi:endonuclease/exonuclease/phosphatase family metal-dependent hydrolase